MLHEEVIQKIKDTTKHITYNCPICNNKLIKIHYAKDYMIYGCKICYKCFYHQNKFIELAFSYEEFFLHP